MTLWWGRPWFDVVLVILLVSLFTLEAALLQREGRLGWAYTFKCITLSFLFGYAMTIPPSDRVPILTPMSLFLRSLVVISLIGTIYELIRARWPGLRLP